MHIETVNLLDGDYELVPANTTTPENVSLICTNLNQDPNQCSESPRLPLNSAQEGKPRCIIPLFYALYSSYYFCICCNNFIVQLRFLGVDRKP